MLRASLQTTPLLAAALLGMTACGEPTPPCTDCPDVAATYQMVAEETQVNDTGESQQLCAEVYYTGATDVVVLEQSGSALQLTGYLTVEGTLWADDTMTFNRVDFANSSVGPVTARISAHFAPENGKKIILGRLRFDIQDYDCDVWSTLTMTEI